MSNPLNTRQIPQEALLDNSGKQVYLGNQYTYSLANMAATGALEVPLAYLANALQPGAQAPISLFVNKRRVCGVSGSQAVLLRYYLNPTGVSGGAAQTPLNLKSGSKNTSIATLKSGPTVTGNGSICSAVFSFSTSDEDSSLIVVDPGSSLLVTVQVSSDTNFTMDLSWYEL